MTTLVAIAAAATAMTSMFAASATAGTVLCEKPVTNCALEDVKPAGTNLVTGATGYEGFVLEDENGGEWLACSYYIIEPKTTMKNGNPLPAEFQSQVQSSNCKFLGSPGLCSNVSMNNPPTEIEAAKNGGGTVKIGSASQPLQVSMFCDYLEVESTCVYTASDTVTMTVSEWGETAKISGAPMKQTAGDFFAGCGSKGSSYTLHVDNILDNVDPDYIASATETVLCSAPYGQVSVCPNSQIRPAGATLITAPLLSEHHITVGEFTCSSGNISFTTTEQSGAPLDATTSGHHLLKSSCVPPGQGTCSSTTVNAPAASIESTGFAKGAIHIGSASEPLTFSFTCNGWGFDETCTFAATDTVTMEVEGEGNIGTIESAALTRTAGNWFLCGGDSLTLSAEVRVDFENTINVV